MYQPITLFIGLRYIYGRRSDRFGRLVSSLSSIGIMLGVMSMIVVLSVMNGFERDLQNNVLGLMPQALITTPENVIDPQKIPASKLQNLKGIKHIAPITTSDVVIQSAQNISAGVMLGINPEQYEPLSKYFINVHQNLLQAGQYRIIMGAKLAQQLGIQSGDTVRLIVPSVRQLTPMGGMLSQRLFTLVGVFSANSEVDADQFFVNQQDASRLMRYPLGDITGWRLFLTQPLKVASLSKQKLPDGTVWKDWRERKGALFQAMQMEKNMMGLLLSLIIIVAAFNIMTSLGLLVMDKQREVAILQTQGFTRRQIMAMFIVQGSTSGIVGSVLGALLGIILTGQLEKLLPILGLLIAGESLPVSIDPMQVFIISLSAIFMALLSTLYPSWRAANFQPAEALRYE